MIGDGFCMIKKISGWTRQEKKNVHNKIYSIIISCFAFVYRNVNRKKLFVLLNAHFDTIVQTVSHTDTGHNLHPRRNYTWGVP